MSAFKKLIAIWLLAMISTAAFAITDAEVFVYAEANYPSLFAGTPTAGQYKQYDYRYYQTSQNYLAVDTSGVIWLLGPFTNGGIAYVGPVSAFASAIITWEATQANTNDPALVGKWAMGIPGTSYIDSYGWVISGTGASEGTLTINSDGSYSWATPWGTYTGALSLYNPAAGQSHQGAGLTNWGTLTDGLGSSSYYLYLDGNAITLINIGTGFFGMYGGRTH